MYQGTKNNNIALNEYNDMVGGNDKAPATGNQLLHTCGSQSTMDTSAARTVLSTAAACF